MRWLDMTWTEVERLPREATILILPVGATEAHGPHLPLGTDGIISEAVAEAVLPKLEEHGLKGVILPTLHFTAAEFARAFPGTVSFRPETVAAVIAELAGGLAEHGFQRLAVANSHLDPTHLSCLARALESLPLRVAFPNIVRRKLAARLTPEFQSGACHAGQYEGSIVKAARPELVRMQLAAQLPDIESSLVTAIAAGKTSFAEAGGPQAYFGSPRGISAEEGRQSIDILAQMLLEAVLSQAQ